MRERSYTVSSSTSAVYAGPCLGSGRISLAFSNLRMLALTSVFERVGEGHPLQFHPVLDQQFSRRLSRPSRIDDDVGIAKPLGHGGHAGGLLDIRELRPALDPIDSPRTVGSRCDTLTKMFGATSVPTTHHYIQSCFKSQRNGRFKVISSCITIFLRSSHPVPSGSGIFRYHAFP